MGGKRAPFHVRPHKGSPFWWWDFTIDGDRFRAPTHVLVGPGGGGKTEADRETAAAWLEECARQGKRADASAFGVETDTVTLVAKYIANEVSVRARKRAARYSEIEELRLMEHVVPRFPVVSMVTPTTWDEAQAEMHAGGLKLSTIQKVTISLRLFMRYCSRIGAVPVLPELRAPTGEEAAAEAAERRAFDEAERDRFLRAVAKLEARAHRVYTTLLYTALRKSGLERMLPRWIDWRTGYVTFPAGAMKKRRTRTFYLHPLARKAIKAELAARGNLDPDQPVFGLFDYDGRRRNADGTKRGLFWRAVRVAKIKDQIGLTAHHVTRHTACSIAGNNGATLAELMALGGWDTPAMAMRYFHADAKQAKGAVDRL
jgi:integrase